MRHFCNAACHSVRRQVPISQEAEPLAITPHSLPLPHAAHDILASGRFSGETPQSASSNSFDTSYDYHSSCFVRKSVYCWISSEIMLISDSTAG